MLSNVMASLVSDVKQSLRSLRRAPALALVTVATVAAGIAASATVFALIDTLFGRPLSDVRDPSRLVNVHATQADGTSFHSVSLPAWRDIGDGGGSFSGLAAFSSGLVSLTDSRGEPRLAIVQVVTGNYFSVLGARPALGRFFGPAEDSVRGRDAVAVLGYGTWKSRFHADPSIVGRAISINGRSVTVVGVAPAGFSGTFLAVPFDVWVPAAMADTLSIQSDLESRGRSWLEMVGRLAAGRTIEDARLRLKVVARRQAQDFPESQRGVGYDLRPVTGFEDELRGAAVGFFGVLAALAGLVLMIAGVNVSGVLLARALGRERELGIRYALGAGRRRLTRLLLLETLLLFLSGGAVGAWLSTGTTRLLERFRLPLPIPITFDFSPGTRGVGFALLVSTAAGLLFGLFVALPATRIAIAAGVSRSRATERPATSRLRSLFVILQLAGSVLLLVTAGLLLRTVRNAGRADPGFEPDDLLVTRFDLAMLGYDAARARAFRDGLLQRVSTMPGVESAAIAGVVPLGSGNRSGTVRLPRRISPEEGVSVDLSDVGETYFSTMRIPIVRGRAFDRRDAPGARDAAVVNETLAEKLWPGRDAVGAELDFEGRALTVVGVARNGKYRRLAEDPQSYLYLAARQAGERRHFLVLRAKGSREALAAALGRELAALEPALPRSALLTAREHMGFSLLPQRVAGAIAGALGAIGLVLSSVGLAALVAFSVGRRTREIGVRLALGAMPNDVLRLEIWRGIRVAVAGLLLGCAAAVVSTRVLGGLLFGVTATDPATLSAVFFLLAAVALAACYLPARRVTRIAPTEAFRTE
jgi:predicted permease